MNLKLGHNKLLISKNRRQFSEKKDLNVVLSITPSEEIFHKATHQNIKN